MLADVDHDDGDDVNNQGILKIKSIKEKMVLVYAVQYAIRQERVFSLNVAVRMYCKHIIYFMLCSHNHCTPNYSLR